MRCIDLFSGCGGMSLGFERSGIEIVAALENWDKAVEVYQENFSHPCYLHDISNEIETLKVISKYQPEMIIGGPPCQDFSSAGKRDESLGRADLTYTFANIITQYRPQWFVMENVERIKKSAILSNVIEQFRHHGYGLTATVIDASYCNTPQARKRFFLIGELGGEHNALLPILKQNLNSSPMSVREYLGDSLGLEYYYRHPRNYSRRGIFSIDEPSPTVRGVNRPIPSGYTKHPSDPIDIDNPNLRPLTTIERSYLQTFPENFKFFGSKTNLEQMIGNAVPVNLAQFVAQSILEYTSQKNHLIYQQKSLFDFEYNEPILPTKVLHKEIVA
ncbi:MAG: DNA cytosine methyltransferase [Campylobacterales bacterium]|nr:DNA cytosine methyltransferase [Campylobacterales bacterium]